MYSPRIKSAPPLELNFDIPTKTTPRNTLQITRPDGTPLTLEDLIDSEDSSTSVGENNINQAKESENIVPQVSNTGEVIQGTTLLPEVSQNSPTQQPNSQNEIVDEEKTDQNVYDIKNLNIESQIVVNAQTETQIDSPTSRCVQDIDLMLENLIRMFAKNAPTKRIRELCYTFDQIFSIKERISKPIKLIMKKKDKNAYKADKFKKDTCIETARLELNRLAAKNANSVVANLKKLKVETIAEMKEIAGILYKKAISEPTFVKQYAGVVYDLKKVWQSEEEKGAGINQTVFFGTLLTETLKALENKEKWTKEETPETQRSGVDTHQTASVNDADQESTNHFVERIKLEEKIEEAESERYKKKNRTLGTVDFLSSLYSLNVISFNHINACIQTLLQSDEAENIEVLCYLVEAIGEKMIFSGKESIINNVCQFLSVKKGNYENRIRFMIENLLEKRKGWKSGQPQVSANIFSCLDVDEDTHTTNTTKHDESHKRHNGQDAKDNVESKSSVTGSSDKEAVNQLKIVADINVLVQDLSAAFSDEDKVLLFDNVRNAEKKYEPSTFYFIYFQEAISNYKAADSLIDFIIFSKDRVGVSKSDLITVLSDLKAELDVLKMDFPIAATKYAELILKLRCADMIDSTTFNLLKTKDFDKKVTGLVNAWKNVPETEKLLSIAFTEEELNYITKQK